MVDASDGYRRIHYRPWTDSHLLSRLSWHPMGIRKFHAGSRHPRLGNLSTLAYSNNDQMAVLDKAGVAQNPLRCVNGQGIQGYVPTGVSGNTWQNLVAADIPYDALLMYEVNGTEIQPYSHYINGTKQSGIFLGSEGYTTWGFKKDTDTEQGTYWEARLLGADSEDPSTGKPLFDGEITGFLKVYGS